jgi:hypothetical protein
MRENVASVEVIVANSFTDWEHCRYFETLLHEKEVNTFFSGLSSTTNSEVPISRQVQLTARTKALQTVGTKRYPKSGSNYSSIWNYCHFCHPELHERDRIEFHMYYTDRKVTGYKQTQKKGIFGRFCHFNLLEAMKD